MWTGHRKAIRKLTLISTVSPSLRRRANVWNVSFRIFLRCPIHIINQVDKWYYYDNLTDLYAFEASVVQFYEPLVILK